MLTPEIKQAWLDWNSQTIENFKDADIDDFLSANEFDISENEISDLLAFKIECKYKETEKEKILHEFHNKFMDSQIDINDSFKE